MWTNAIRIQIFAQLCSQRCSIIPVKDSEVNTMHGFQEDHCLQYVYLNAVKEMTWEVCVSIMLHNIYIYTYKL